MGGEGLRAACNVLSVWGGGGGKRGEGLCPFSSSSIIRDPFVCLGSCLFRSCLFLAWLHDVRKFWRRGVGRLFQFFERSALLDGQSDFGGALSFGLARVEACIAQGLSVVHCLFVFEEHLVFGFDFEDSLDHLFQFENCVVFLGVQEDGGPVTTNHQKHVHGGVRVQGAGLRTNCGVAQPPPSERASAERAG